MNAAQSFKTRVILGNFVQSGKHLGTLETLGLISLLHHVVWLPDLCVNLRFTGLEVALFAV